MEHVINEVEIENIKNENNFYGYVDTSAKEDIGIDRVFYEMGELLIKTKGKNKRQNKKLVLTKKKKFRCIFCKPDF